MKKFEKTNLINPQDLNDLQSHFKDRHIQFVDASFVLPNSTADVIENFKSKRIKNSVFFDIRDAADHNVDLPNMLPPHDVFQAHAQGLGIRNDHILIFYGQDNMLMGPARAWWMFKGFGHDHAYVLNGTLNTLSDVLEIDTTAPHVPVRSDYVAMPFNIDMIATMAQVMNISNNAFCSILDARGAARFSGESPEPRQGMRSGHIPNSTNIPYSSLLNKNGRIKAVKQLKEILQPFIGEAKIITTCGSGVTACAITLALHEIGHMNVSVYDGSWSEWGQERSATPVSTSSL